MLTASTKALKASLLACVVAALVAAGLLLAARALAAPPVHSARGGGTLQVGDVLDTIAFTAEVDADGNVKGEAEVQRRDHNEDFHVVIDCLSVSGNQAWLGGTITSASDPNRVGDHTQFSVIDNGEGHGVTDMGSVPISGGGPNSCHNHPVFTMLPWTNGNVQVR